MNNPLFMPLLLQAPAIVQAMQKRIVTPNSIDDRTANFANSLSPKQLPVYVAVRAVAGARANDCHQNVPIQVKNRGGKAVYGWTLWQFPKLFLTAEFHCCWQSPEGELIDITPKNDKRILFVPDLSRKFEGKLIPSVYRQLHPHRTIAEYIEAEKAGSAVLRSRLPPQEMAPVIIHQLAASKRLLEFKV